MQRDRFIQVIEILKLSIFEYDTRIAELADLGHLVANNNGTRFLHALPKDLSALTAECNIANRRNLVDEVCIEPDAHRRSEREAGSHAG